MRDRQPQSDPKRRADASRDHEPQNSIPVQVNVFTDLSIAWTEFSMRTPELHIAEVAGRGTPCAGDHHPNTAAALSLGGKHRFVVTGTSDSNEATCLPICAFTATA